MTNYKWKFLIDTLSKRNFKQIANTCLYSLNLLAKPDIPLNPLFAIISSTDRCNLKCQMCPRYDKEIKLAEISFDDYKRLIDQMPYLHSVSPVGLGEPLIHKDILDMIKYPKEKGIDVFLYSNGTLLNRGTSDKLLELGLDSISFSVDGATEETYESIRIGAKFDQVMENITYLVNQRNKMKSEMHIVLQAVIMQKNMHELPDFIRLAKRIGVDAIGFGDVQYSFEIGISKKDQSLRMVEDKEKLQKLINETIKIAKELNIEILSLPQTEQRTSWSSWNSCKYPWTYITINSNGMVRPCCGTHKISMGNAFEESIKDIWNNERFIEWRRAMKSSNPPNECKTCTIY